MSRCLECGRSEPEVRFRTKVDYRVNKSYTERKCLDCTRELNKQNPNYRENMRGQDLRKHYGIGTEDYDRMLAEQNNCCKICGRHMSEFSRRLAVDHVHDEDGFIRGLLCGQCNTGIGKLQDNPEILQRAITYIMTSGRMGS